MSVITGGPGSTAHVTGAGDRHKLMWAGRTVFDVVLGGAETGGMVSLLDQWGKRGDVTPMHIHRNESEIFYVLEGGITAWSGDDVHELDAGGAVYLPPGRPHAFGIRTEEARLITVCGPTFASFVTAAGVPMTDGGSATWDFDVDRIMSAAAEHDIDIVGPPPELPA